MDEIRLAVAQRHTRHRVVVDVECVKLTGQIGLQKRKEQNCQNGKDEEHRQLILAEGIEGASPIGIIGKAAVLNALFIELRKGEGIFPAQGCLEIFRAFLFELLELRMLDDSHQRFPPFDAKLMRGSSSTISKSPKIRPTTPTHAKTSTMPCTMLLSCFFTTSTSRPPMPGMA